MLQLNVVLYHLQTTENSRPGAIINVPYPVSPLPRNLANRIVVSSPTEYRGIHRHGLFILSVGTAPPLLGAAPSPRPSPPRPNRLQHYPIGRWGGSRGLTRRPAILPAEGPSARAFTKGANRGNSRLELPTTHSMGRLGQTLRFLVRGG